jgi:uncharacterized protein (DUF1697 family)
VRHVALLRAVNLGPHNKVAMADLRALAMALGLREPTTLLQSGNLVFQSGRTPAQLERLLEKAISGRFGSAIDVMVRSATDLAEAVAGNPFHPEAKIDPAHLLLGFLKDAPPRAAVTSLQRAITGREQVQVKGRHAYFVYPDGVGNSKLTPAVIALHLATAVTARNWNTVMKVSALLEPA